jgi:hypothetical protein
MVTHLEEQRSCEFPSRLTTHSQVLLIHKKPHFERGMAPALPIVICLHKVCTNHREFHNGFSEEISHILCYWELNKLNNCDHWMDGESFTQLHHNWPKVIQNSAGLGTLTFKTYSMSFALSRAIGWLVGPLHVHTLCINAYLKVTWKNINF